MTEKEFYLTQLALNALIALSVKPEWSIEKHSKFYFKTMDKKTKKLGLQYFYDELQKVK